ncbi:hypothetical protein PFISCL1PPCAC_5523 [Pristionchus fissidentatus]|uniref:Coiled-coil domain-containing protein n=1 Tax=Pristionchus fissidentatus TaxID=1538716 RepID=A0AAV5V654_9BILA|nr:hypothetical protein PFISCL1PPCAC_5523 [Pristionchus fissidentatus]
MASGDVPNSVKEARDRFDLFSDASLASRLQDQEFGAHFNANRQERRLVGSDTKVSREEQMTEIQRQTAIRREQLNRVASTDEEIARRLQEEFDREEQVKRFLAQKQAEDDERMARELQNQEQGRIVGHGSYSTAAVLPSTPTTPSFPTVSSSTPVRRPTDHVYAAQNNLNEHYADRASTSLIDLSAEDALTTIASPAPFRPASNIDPFLSSTESRNAAYVPSDIVPLLPPPPEFIVRREAERTMEELSRLQPRLDMAGVILSAAPAASAAPSSPPPSYYAPPPVQQLQQQQPPLVNLTTPSGTQLNATNPFLLDLMGEESSGMTSGRREERQPYFSEFGLPPPSSLARGDGDRGTLI